jgi:hypothetical protein
VGATLLTDDQRLAEATGPPCTVAVRADRLRLLREGDHRFLDYGVVLRAVLFAAGRRRAREVTGITTGDAVPGWGR